MSLKSPATRLPEAAANGNDQIQIRGARENNLRDVQVAIPHGAVVVITGPSGSGKSSLAINTVFAEGQRQFIETISPYARSLIQTLPRPNVDSIDGLQPTLCIDQHPSNHSPRSTVGTVTEIHDYLRVMMARAADVRCHQCLRPIRPLSESQIVSELESLPEGSRVVVLAPLVRGRKGKHAAVLERIRKEGLLRVRVDGQILELDDVGELKATQVHTIAAVTDRLVIRPGNTERITESVRLAVRLGDGVCLVSIQRDRDSGGYEDDRVFNTRHSCVECGAALVALEPRSFSFNSPYGACPKCEGLGWQWQFDEGVVLPDHRLSIDQGAIAPWRSLAASQRKRHQKSLQAFFETRAVTPETKLDAYSERDLRELVQGDGNTWVGLFVLLEQEWATTPDSDRQDELEACQNLLACDACQASRMAPHVLSATLGDKSIIDICRMPVSVALVFFESLEWDDDRVDIGEPLQREIVRRLSFLCNVGLGYLTLDRPADTLSGGEFQRTRLSAALGNGLANVCYVLDEPTVGLHPSDNQRLIDAMQELRDEGNTVIVVEHDADVMHQADWIIDIGPGAGPDGGQVLFSGRLTDMMDCPSSTTARYLSGDLAIRNRVRKGTRNDPKESPAIRLGGVTTNNLAIDAIAFPLQQLTVVTGISGSGKSSLVQDTLGPALKRHFGMAAPAPGSHEAIDVPDALQGIVAINQRPIGRTPRSCPATWTGVMAEIRKLFAATRDAKANGFSASRFSFNSAAGRCPKCKGLGQLKLEMNFLPETFVECPDCHGRRYEPRTLSIRYRGKSIADVLQMPIEDVATFFENVESIRRIAEALNDVGLGYLSLGQPSTTLSGGEAQRVRLATELRRKKGTGLLYLLDEPTTGLHFQDIERLLNVMHHLVDRGNTVIVVEHHPDVVALADWEIRLGPGSGPDGGRIVRVGPPE